MISNIYLNYYYAVFAKFFQDRKCRGEDLNVTGSNHSVREICHENCPGVGRGRKLGLSAESRGTRWEQLYFSSCGEKPGQLRKWVVDLQTKVGLWSGKQLSPGMPHVRGGQAWATQAISNSSAIRNPDHIPHHQTSAPHWTEDPFDLNSQRLEKECHFPSLNIDRIVNNSKILL